MARLRFCLESPWAFELLAAVEFDCLFQDLLAAGKLEADRSL